MDDVIRTLSVGLFALLAIHGSLEKRARRDVTRAVAAGFESGGSLHTTLAAEGPLGLFASRISVVDVYGDGLSTSRVPFEVIPRSGWSGHIDHLRLHLTGLRLVGLPVNRLDVDLPDVT